MFFSNLDLLPIVIATLIVTVLTNIWYSPALLGRLWMTKAELEKEVDMVRVVHSTWMTLILYALIFIFVQLLLRMTEVAQMPRRYTVVSLILVLLCVTIERSFREGKSAWHIALFSLFLVFTIISGLAIIIFWPW